MGAVIQAGGILHRQHHRMLGHPRCGGFDPYQPILFVLDQDQPQALNRFDRIRDLLGHRNRLVRTAWCRLAPLARAARMLRCDYER